MDDTFKRFAICAMAFAINPSPVTAAADAAAPVPRGILPDAAQPLAYRIDMIVLPEQERFSGHVEIDVTLKEPTSSLYLHGRNLNVTAALARNGGRTVRAVYTQVDPLGVARLHFAMPLAAGSATLIFDYDAPFGTGPSGLFHAKTGNSWYAWTQFESTDARAAFPSFDQPGYKTPFKVSLTTSPGLTAVSNETETGTARVGALVRHNFEITRPLPTYLVAFSVGPFAVATGTAARTPERAQAMPLRIVATQPNKDKMDFALQNSGPIVALLERYFGRPFPFSKLDQIGSPVIPGAMENAGAVTYGDSILLFDKSASTGQKQAFGMIVAHELAHQWFGDLVTPKWWDDIWLNESFANWMGYRIGNEWRPDLKIGVGAVEDAFQAMATDELRAGRSIHQPIRTSGEIDSAFDAVTYGKGGQVLAMIAAYLGDEKFRDGVRLHLDRHAYDNASTEEFFASLAEAARDPRVLDALRSFVDQQGVPIVEVHRVDGGLSLAQKRYAMLGTIVAPQLWTIPLCIRVGEVRQCTLLDKVSKTIPMTSKGAIMANSDGAGYFRFSLPEIEWRALISDADRLAPGEALALTDSLWAGFRAGEVAPALLIDAAKVMAANPYSAAALGGGQRFADLRARGIIDDATLPNYRKLINAIYRPIFVQLGFDPKAGIYDAEDPDRQKLRSNIVSLLWSEAKDEVLRAKLAAAAQSYLNGDASALDLALLGDGLAAYASTGQVAVSALFERAVVSDDTLFREVAIGALASNGNSGTGHWLIAHIDDKRLHTNDRLNILQHMAVEPDTRDLATNWLIEHYDMLVEENSIFYASALPSLPSHYCSVEKATEIEKALRSKVEHYEHGVLALDRTVERIHSCALLMQKRGAEILAVFN